MNDEDNEDILFVGSCDGIYDDLFEDLIIDSIDDNNNYINNNDTNNNHNITTAAVAQHKSIKEEEERRRKNRESAARCRQRLMQRIADKEAKVSELKKQREAIVNEINLLDIQLQDQLKTMKRHQMICLTIEDINVNNNNNNNTAAAATSRSGHYSINTRADDNM